MYEWSGRAAAEVLMGEHMIVRAPSQKDRDVDGRKSGHRTDGRRGEGIVGWVCAGGAGGIHPLADEKRAGALTDGQTGGRPDGPMLSSNDRWMYLFLWRNPQ